MAPRFRWHVISDEDSGPGPRSRHGLVYVPSRGTMVLFGGIVWGPPGHLASDTWEFDRDGWIQIETDRFPVARHRGAMVHDPSQDVTVLFGGQDRLNVVLNDTWFYKNSEWKPFRAGLWGTVPGRRCGHAMAFDAAIGETVLFGGINSAGRSLSDTWTFNGKRWRLVAGPGPSRRRYPAFCYNPDLKGCVLHGGSLDDNGHKQYGDTWLFRDGEWRRLHERFVTTVRDDHGIGYHELAKCFLMLNGNRGEPTVSQLVKSGWEEVDVVEPCPRHQCAPLTWNAGLGGLVLHGGETGHCGAQYAETLLLRLEDAG